MNIKYYNCPTPKPTAPQSLPEPPAFLSYSPNFARIDDLANKYAHKANLVVIGHGGSITTFAGLYNALKEFSTKQVYFVSTVDPDYITEVKHAALKSDTVVVAISKSGETVTQLEAVLQFIDYDLLFVTGEQGPLHDIAANLQAEVVGHPEIGGRYSGLTEVGLLPAALCGFDVRSIHKAAQSVYSSYALGNIAMDAASVMHQLEGNGFVDVFMPVYDTHIFSITDLILQLCHESFGKDGKGQTYFAHTAPESQHHTNQRFFGGRKNMAGWFLSSEQSIQNISVKVPAELLSVSLKDGALSVLNNISLHKAMQFEREATIEHGKQAGIPIIDLVIERRSSAGIGALIAFWQLFAVYSSALRNVDPFSQPEVELSKKISFAKRLEYK